MITIPILNSLYVFNFYGRSKQSKEITCTVKDFLERSSSSDILICDCDDIEITLKRDFDEGFNFQEIQVDLKVTEGALGFKIIESQSILKK